MLNIKALLTKILGRLNDIGAGVMHEPAAVACATSKYRQVAYVTVPAGTWMFTATAVFPYNNTTGVRRAFLSLATSNYDNVTDMPPAMGNICFNQIPVTGSYQAYVPLATCFRTFSGSTTVRLIAWQNSGASVNVTGRLYAMRIK